MPLLRDDCAMLNSSPLSHKSHGMRRSPVRSMPGNYQSDAPSESISSLNTNKDDFAQSTRPNLEDDLVYRQLRTTAKKRGQYSVPKPQEPVRSSALRNSWKDFTKDFSDEKIDMEDDSSLELEMPRGLPAHSRGTPSKLNRSYTASDVVLDGEILSPYQSRATTRAKTSRKSAGQEGDLRRNAQLRRASSQKTTGVISKGTAPSANNTYTEESFALPDVTGLSKLIDNVAEARPQMAKSRARHSYGARSAPSHADQFVPVESVPISDENKWQMLALQSLHERIKTLEQDNAQLSHQCQHYKSSVEELKAELNIERTMRKADSALGSDEDKPSKKSELLTLQVTNIRLETENRRLSRRVQELEEQADSSENLTKRMTSERNKLVRELSATQDKQSLKARQENTVLKKENATLQERLDELIVLNEDLQAQLDETHDRHDDATQQWTQRVQDTANKAAEGDTAVIAENQTLRLQLDELKSNYDNDVQKLRKEAESRRAAARAAQIEFARLQAQHQRLKRDLKDARDQQLLEEDRVAAGKSGNAQAQSRVNDELRGSNDALRKEVALLRANFTQQKRSGRSSSKSADRLHPITLGRADDTNARGTSGEQQVEADTYISLMSPEEMMRIRRDIEREFASKRGRSNEARPESQLKVSRRSTSRPKTPTTRALTDDVDNDSQYDDEHNVNHTMHDTARSHHSTGSRRRAAKDDEAGMTSAFIIPDVNIDATSRPSLSAKARNVLSSLAPHSPRQCTVCHRIVSSQNPAMAPDSPKISTPVPVSSGSAQQEIDATMRPSEPPLKALSRVIRQLADEIVHLKLDLHANERRLAVHDPARSKRERDVLHEAIEAVNKSIQIKSDQMYSLYDVLEGHKNEIGHKQAAAVVDELVEDVSEDVREILEELKSGRRVTIKSPPDASYSHKAVLDSESEDGAGRDWDGFSETGSLSRRL